MVWKKQEKLMKAAFYALGALILLAIGLIFHFEFALIGALLWAAAAIYHLVTAVFSAKLSNASSAPHLDEPPPPPQITHDLQRLREQTEAAAEVFLDIAGSFSGDGDYDNAISTYSLAIAANPFCIEALNGRGNTYIKTGEFEKAIEDYDAVLKIDPNHAKVLTNRGYAYARNGEIEKAVADCEAALRIDPSLEFAKEIIEITKKTIKSTHSDNTPEVVPEIEYLELGGAEPEIEFW
jgi:tetratricopeptide (TPR) repeat protein